jgi:hypothetical protein
MYSTKFGPFEGDTWESLMQICFRLKYETEHYQPIPASSGDCGIEGFTRKGKVFQCYCPDNNLSSRDLYEKQRDKITRDLSKLSLYENRIKTFLGDTKIKEWIFVTPEYRMNDILLHCNNKKEEILASNLSILDPNFEIVIHDIDNFIKEIPLALKGEGKKLYIGVDSHDDGSIALWKDQSIDLAGNAVRKHLKRFKKDALDVESKVNTLTESTIEYFLDHDAILRRWERIHPEEYDKYLILLSQIEKEVQEICMFPSDDNNKLYSYLRELVNKRLKENFDYLNDITLQSLTHGAIADWLLRCPLDFE